MVRDGILSAAIGKLDFSSISQIISKFVEDNIIHGFTPPSTGPYSSASKIPKSIRMFLSAFGGYTMPVISY